MRNQFVYTRKMPIKDTDPVEFKEFRDSFNVDKIIRTVQMPDKLVVLLDDLHERVQEVPYMQKNPKTGKERQAIRREPQVFQTEIHLEGEDIERFYKLTNVEE